MKKFQSRIIAWAVCVLIASCRMPSSVQEDTVLTGLFQPIERPSPIPKNKTQASLDDFSSSLALKLTTIGTKVAIKNTKSDLYDLFHNAYIEAVIRVGGVPRVQGETVVKKLVSSDHALCGGANCGVLFGIKEEDVPRLFNDMLNVVGSSKTLANREKASIRQVVIGSLIPGSQGHSKDPWVSISRVFLEPPLPLALTPATPNDRLSILEVKRAVGFGFIEAINLYTSPDYHLFRMVELHSDEELLQKSIPPHHIKAWQEQIATINSGLKALPKFSGKIYRGVRAIDESILAEWIDIWREKKQFVLGKEGKPALASCSWDPEIAARFLHKHTLTAKSDDVSVIFEISGHQGVSIEHISEFPNEREVLLPSTQKFRIERIVPLEDRLRTFVIHLRGVQTSARNGPAFYRHAA